MMVETDTQERMVLRVIVQKVGKVLTVMVSKKGFKTKCSNTSILTFLSSL